MSNIFLAGGLLIGVAAPAFIAYFNLSDQKTLLPTTSRIEAAAIGAQGTLLPSSTGLASAAARTTFANAVPARSAGATATAPSTLGHLPEMRLRGVGATLSEADIQVMIRKYGFYDSEVNPRGRAPKLVSNLLVSQGGHKAIFDKVTGLMWQGSHYSDNLTHRQALDVVAKMNSKNFGGYNDWRLPTLEEAKSLSVNYIYGVPRTKRHTMFDEGAPLIMWTSDEASNHDAWIAHRGIGHTYAREKVGVWRHGEIAVRRAY